MAHSVNGDNSEISEKSNALPYAKGFSLYRLSSDICSLSSVFCLLVAGGWSLGIRYLLLVTRYRTLAS